MLPLKIKEPISLRFGLFAVLAVLIQYCLAQQSWADEISTFKQVSIKTQSVCTRLYQTPGAKVADLEILKLKNMPETDKIACTLPYITQQIQERMSDLVKLNPKINWSVQPYLTLAARIYDYSLFDDSPHGDQKLELFSVYSDLLILNRLLRQVTPYALALIRPGLGAQAQTFVQGARQASARANELTPWSALLRQAQSVDCYGPFSKDCETQRQDARTILKAAYEELEKSTNTFGYLSKYSSTMEFGEFSAMPSILLLQKIRRALFGERVDGLMGPISANGWWKVRLDTRDTFNYLTAHQKDIVDPLHEIISAADLSCHTVYENLLALALEPAMQLRFDLAPFNPLEKILTDRTAAGLNKMTLSETQALDCQKLAAVETELDVHGLLSRFQRFQAHSLLLSTQEVAVVFSDEFKKASRRFALASDMESVLREIEAEKSDWPVNQLGLKHKASVQELLSFVDSFLKEYSS